MVRIAIILIALVVASPARAQPAPVGPGTAVVQTANNTLLKLLAAKAPAAQVTAAVRSFLDLRGLGKLAMAAHWSKLSTAEQTQFLDLLEKLVEAQYVKAVGAQLNLTIRYLGETKLPSGNILVKTEYATVSNGRTQTVGIDYELAPQGSTWRAIDMVMSGVSTVANYATMFNNIITKTSFANLMAKMNAKLAQMPAAPAPATSVTPAPVTQPAPAATTPTPAPTRP